MYHIKKSINSKSTIATTNVHPMKFSSMPCRSLFMLVTRDKEQGVVDADELRTLYVNFQIRKSVGG